jgi:hypothetical protein
MGKGCVYKNGMDNLSRQLSRFLCQLRLRWASTPCIALQVTDIDRGVRAMRSHVQRKSGCAELLCPASMPQPLKKDVVAYHVAHLQASGTE